MTLKIGSEWMLYLLFIFGNSLSTNSYVNINPFSIKNQLSPEIRYNVRKDFLIEFNKDICKVILKELKQNKKDSIFGGLSFFIGGIGMYSISHLFFNGMDYMQWNIKNYRSGTSCVMTCLGIFPGFAFLSFCHGCNNGLKKSFEKGCQSRFEDLMNQFNFTKNQSDEKLLEIIQIFRNEKNISNNTYEYNWILKIYEKLLQKRLKKAINLIDIFNWFKLIVG